MGSGRKTLWMGGLLIVTIVLVMLVERYYVEGLSFAEAEIKQLDSIDEKQIDLFVEQSNLLTTLASALLAALGALLVKSEGAPMQGHELALLVIAAIFSGSSLYFGYLAYQEVMWMLHSRFFNLEEPHVGWVRRLQFLTFLAGTLFSLLFVWASVRRRQMSGTV